MKIKKGKLNYDQSGRAYPPNPRVKENWDCIWEYEGKYYKLVGDNEHKEWDEVNIYNQIIDEAYINYSKNHFKIWEPGMDYESKESFIRKCKTDPEFSETWGLKIEERELGLEERHQISLNRIGHDGVADRDNMTWHETYNKTGIPTKLITITYNNKTIESYE